MPRPQQGYNQQAAWLLVGFFWGNLYVEESQITWYAFSFVEYIFLCLCVFSNLQEYTNWWVCGGVTNVPPAAFRLWQNISNIYLCVCVFSNLREHTNWWVCSKVTNLPPAAFRLCSEDKIVVNFLPHPPTTRKHNLQLRHLWLHDQTAVNLHRFRYKCFQLCKYKKCCNFLNIINLSLQFEEFEV